jgi:hypothetical protein
LRSPPASPSIGRVMATGHELIQVTVELEAASEPIRGAVRTDAGSRPFDGWMELTAAIEDARIATRDGDPTRDADPKQLVDGRTEANDE